MEYFKNKIAGYKKGNVVFAAIALVSSLLLVGTAAGTLAYKEAIFTSFSRQSQKAFYAADTGIEAAMFFDFANGILNPPPGTLFAMPNDNVPEINDKLTALENSTYGEALELIAPLNPSENVAGATYATTTFYLKFSVSQSENNTKPCAKVAVGKYTDGGGVRTIIISQGYDMSNKTASDCTAATEQTRRVERTLTVDY